ITRVRDRVVDLEAGGPTLRLQSGRRPTWDKLLLATGSVPRRAPPRRPHPGGGGAGDFVTQGDLDARGRRTPARRQAGGGWAAAGSAGRRGRGWWWGAG